MMEERLVLKKKIIWYQTTHMIVFTTQSHRLTLLCGILDKLQPPQSDALENGQEDGTKQFFSDP